MKRSNVIGWIGVGITVAFSGLWAYWGAFENFHEGWYAGSLFDNLLILFAQYLSFSIGFALLALISLRWKRIGLAIHLATGAFCTWFFSGAQFSVLWLLIVLPFAALGLIYFFGDPRPRKWARALIILVPLVIVLAISIPQGIKVSRRVDDGNLGLHVVEGNDVTLAWAPRGPGWPDEGMTWDEAVARCKYLAEDGLTIMESEQNIWRLPTVEEAICSMALHGENAGGAWDADRQKASFERTPDKESPLWDVHSKVIYYWTADPSPKDADEAYVVVYDGGVYDRKKAYKLGYLSFRAVRDVTAE
jgi:hypothetical protein